jgi:hypothetical protein
MTPSIKLGAPATRRWAGAGNFSIRLGWLTGGLVRKGAAEFPQAPSNTLANLRQSPRPKNEKDEDQEQDDLGGMSDRHGQSSSGKWSLCSPSSEPREMVGQVNDRR